MNKSRSSSFAVPAAAAIASIAGSILATTALATVMPNPAPLAPGQSSVSVPIWGTGASNYTTSPKGSFLTHCIDGTCAGGGLSSTELDSLLTGAGGFLEIAGTTNLNPFGSNDLIFAVAFGGAAADNVQSVEIPGLSSWSIDVQACDPGLSSLLPCPATGSGATAARDSHGDVTFSATSGSFPVNPVLVGQATDVYAIYTDAPKSALGPDPTIIITYSNGSTVDYSALSLMPPSTGTVPEPSVLGLFAAGLAALGLGMGLRRRSGR